MLFHLSPFKQRSSSVQTVLRSKEKVKDKNKVMASISVSVRLSTESGTEMRWLTRELIPSSAPPKNTACV